MKERIGSFAVKEGSHTFTMSPIEDYLHLQSMVRIELRGRHVGAYLLKKDKQSDFSVTFGFECTGIHSCLTESEVEAAMEKIASGLNDFPQSESLTVHLGAIKSDRERQAHLASLIDRTPVSELKFLLTGERQRTQELSRLGLREPKSLRLYVTYKRHSDESNQSDWVDRELERVEEFLSLFGGQEAQSKVRLESLLNSAFFSGYIHWEQILSTKLGLQIRALTEDDLWSTLWLRFNQKTLPIEIPQLIILDDRGIREEIRSDLHATSLLCADDVLRADRKWMRVRRQFEAVLTFWDKPGEWQDAKSQLHYLSQLIERDIVTDTDIICQIRPADPTLTRTNMQRLIKQSSVSAHNASSRQDVDVAAQINASRSVAAQAELYEGKRPFHTAVVIIVRRPTIEELNEACRYIENFFHRPAWVVRETQVAWRIWLQTLPIVQDALLVLPQGNRRLLYLSTELPGLLPIVTTNSPDREGLELIGEDGGTPVFIDIFSEHKHLGIFGTTRSGKSVLVSGILTQALCRFIPVVALDYPKPDGTSTFTDYTHFLERRGAYFDVGAQAINLFERPNLRALPPDKQKERFEDYKDFLSGCLLAMVISTSAEDLLRQTIRTILYCALNQFFSDPKIVARYEAAESSGIGTESWQAIPTLRDFLSFCTLDRLQQQLQLEEGISWNAVPKAMEQIRLRLTYWLASRVGKAISSPSSVSTQAQLIVFALRQVSQSEDAAILSLVAYSAALRRALSSPISIFFIDESPILFQFPEIARLVGTICANGAKSGIRVILTAQDPNTVANSVAGAQIFQNITIRLVGRTQKNATPSFEQIFLYPKDIICQCERFKPNRHNLYTQWLLDHSGIYTFCRYYPAYVQLAIVANNPDEQAVRSEYLRRCPDKYEAVAEFGKFLQAAFRADKPIAVAAEECGIRLPELVII